MLISIAAVLFIAYLGLALYLYFMQPTFLYGPMREVPYTPGELGLDFENVVLRTADGLRLNGWYIPAEKPEQDAKVPDVVLKTGMFSIRKGIYKLWNIEEKPSAKYRRSGRKRLKQFYVVSRWY